MSADARPTARAVVLPALVALLGGCADGGTPVTPGRDGGRDANRFGPAYLWYAGAGVSAHSLEQTQVSNEDEPAYFVVPDLPIHNCHDVAFDAQGNLWTIPVSGDRILRLPAAGLGLHEPLLPDLEVTSAALHAAQGLVFDGAGRLWVLSYAGAGPQLASISRFDGLRSLSGRQSASPSVTLSPGPRPEDAALFTQSTSIALDAAGNLWLAAIAGVSRFDRVGELRGAVVATPSAVIATGEAYASLAFDARGSLWITAAKDGYLVLRFDRPGALSGVVKPEPAARVRLDSGGARFAGGMAFDHEDGLWIMLSNRVVRLRHAGTLTGDVRPVPVTILGRTFFPDLASKIALQPKPAGLPIFVP